MSNSISLTEYERSLGGLHAATIDPSEAWVIAQEAQQRVIGDYRIYLPQTAKRLQYAPIGGRGCKILLTREMTYR